MTDTARCVDVLARLVFLGVVAAALGGCQRDISRSPRPTASPVPTLAATRRIVTLAPSATEIVFALDCGDRVVGVSGLCNYPPAAADKPRVGGWLDADCERILSLEPDLVILQGGPATVRELCGEHEIDLLDYGDKSLTELFDAIAAIGRRLGCSDRADRLVSRIKGEMRRTSTAVRSRGRPSVLLSISRTPHQPLGQIYTAGRDSFLTELVRIAGGRSIFADVDVPYPQISLEEVAARAPEVIVELMPEKDNALTDRQALRQWRTIASLPAVRNQRVHVLSQDYVLLPGPRVGKLARLLARAIHPEATLE